MDLSRKMETQIDVNIYATKNNAIIGLDNGLLHVRPMYFFNQRWSIDKRSPGNQVQNIF